MESTETTKTPIPPSTEIAEKHVEKAETVPSKKIYQKKARPVSISEPVVEKKNEDKASQKGKGKAKIDEVGNKKDKQSKKRDSQGALNTTEGEPAHFHMDSEDEVLDAKIDAYIEEGENVGGEFPINKDITLRQDMLSKHLAKLRVSVIKKLR